MSIPENAILVKANVVELYLSISPEALDKQDEKSIPKEDLVKMAGFVLKKNFLEIERIIKQFLVQLSVSYLQPYTCRILDKLVTSSLE